MADYGRGRAAKFPLSLANGLLKNMWKVRIRYFDHNKDKGSNAPGNL
nr:MAG TPA: hypothetical protein [Caudoviricetes sp.]DAQ49601.1 MAG TPA: hypothetical protein [Caudoviricetes sp.]DAY92983.1 MAG TPA: hypothetical protein [Caudoviricetes sp.]